MRLRLLFCFGVMVCFLANGCGTVQPNPTAEQYFAAAKANLQSRDYDTAIKNLDRVIQSAGDRPLGQEGMLFRAVLLTALAEGDMRMAEAYAQGAQANQGKPEYIQLYKLRRDYYGMAQAHMLNAMEAMLAQRQTIAAQPIQLDLPATGGPAAEPAALGRIESGILVPVAERNDAELECSRIAVQRRFSSMAKASDDLTRGRATLAAEGVQIDPRAYLLDMSEELLRLSTIFGPRGLNEDRYTRAAHDVVLGNLAVLDVLLEKTPDADLTGRAQKVKTDCEARMKALPPANGAGAPSAQPVDRHPKRP